MKNFKRIIALVLVLALALSVSGCMRVEDKVVVDDAGNATITENVYIEKSAITTLLKQFSPTASDEDMAKQVAEIEKEYKVAKFDDKEYYFNDQMLNITADKKITPSITITKDIYYMPISGAYSTSSISNMLVGGATTPDLSSLSQYASLLSDSTEMLYSMYVLRSVTLPSEIVYTNGELSADKKTVTFKGTYKEILSSGGWYAMTAAGKAAYDSDVTPPVITGIESQGIYSSLSNLYATDDVAVESYKINDVEYQIAYDGDGYSFLPIDSTKEGLIQGQNTLKVTDVKGNFAEITFVYDTVAPSITGAKSGKTYKKKRTLKISDANGIKSITLNGTKKNLSKLKSGNKYSLKVTKKGKNTIKVTDKAGNTKSIYIKIKK